MVHVDGLVQDFSNPSALAMELLQSCTNPSIYRLSILGGKSVEPCLKENSEIYLKTKEMLLNHIEIWIILTFRVVLFNHVILVCLIYSLIWNIQT